MFRRTSSADTVREERGDNMRLIDADELEELFREVIGRIAKRPDINFNMEHMIRASAMVIEMIKDAPTVTPEPHWIPVTEEPIPDGEYLVTWTSEIQEKPIISIVCRYSEVWDCWELQALGHQDIKILAYMPLPEPFKGVKDGRD